MKSKYKYYYGFTIEQYQRIRAIWRAMIYRCTNNKATAYKWYGGKGVTVCNDWLEFDNYIRWYKDNKYKDGLTLDRIDVNGNYEPNNCRFITQTEQSENKTDTLYVVYHGCKVCLKRLCKDLKLPYKPIWYRLTNLKWDVEKAIDTPLQKKTKQILKPSYTYKGFTGTARAICKHINVDYRTIQYRLHNGWATDRAFGTPTRKPYSYKSRALNKERGGVIE